MKDISDDKSKWDLTKSQYQRGNIALNECVQRLDKLRHNLAEAMKQYQFFKEIEEHDSEDLKKLDHNAIANSLFEINLIDEKIKSMIMEAKRIEDGITRLSEILKSIDR